MPTRRPTVRLPKDRPLARDEVRRVFEQYEIEYGGIRPAARVLGITPQYLQDLLGGSRPGRKALEAIGFEEIESYRKKESSE